MASSAPETHWLESDLANGSGPCWDEAVDRVPERHVEETGVEESGHVGRAGQWDKSPAWGLAELEFLGHGRRTKDPLPHQGLLAQSDGGFDLSDLQEFEWGEPRQDGDSARSPLADDGEELEHEGTQGDPTSPAYWHPQRDQPLDMMEEDEDRASSGDVARVEGDWEAGSEGEGYPDLSFEGQYGSDYSASPDALGDAQALYRDYGKSFSFTTDGGEELSGRSDVSPPPCSTLPERPYRPSRRTAADAFESRNRLGESPEFPAETEHASPSGGSLDSPEPSPLAGSTRWRLSQSLLHHLSVEDLQNAPSIDAETFPESSSSESIEDPSRTISPATSAGGARASRRPPVPAAEPLARPAGALEAAGTPPSIQQVGSQQRGRARALRKAFSPALPSKFSRQSRSLSPRGNASQRAERSGSPKSGPARPSLATAEAPQYGRGQLNYPLPDLSKVEPRVRFPKDDQSYRPPRGRTLPMKAKRLASPMVFKSPAEIVREVLLSSTEGSLQKCPTPSTAMVPEEFKSPKQATELVQQLQEDYHKLLTKYAEAENTIDRLRLGAKVSLYADPPKPSHSVHMGSVAHGSKVMAFSIPQIRTAEFSVTPAPALPAALDEGPSSAPGDQETSFLAHSALTSVAGVDACTSTERPFPEDPLTRTLAGQARKFEAQVGSFEGLMQMGRLTPQDQLKGFARLKDAQDALERAYLQAREEYCQQQQGPGPTGPCGEFDPDRAVEGEIFRLGMRLEELKDRIDQALQRLPSPRSCSEPVLSPSCLPTLVSELLPSSPAPSVQVPIPAIRTPYPEAPLPKHAHSRMQVEAEVSSASGEMDEEREELPEPLRHKQFQVEKDFDNLLDQYNSFKTLPESLSMEQLGLEENDSPQEVDGPLAEDAGMEESPYGMLSLKEETARVTSQPQPPERKPRTLQPGELQQLIRKSSRLPSVQGEESLPRSMAIKARPPDTIPKPSFGRQQETLSRQSSMAGSADSEHLPQKPFHQAKSSRSEDQRIVSPETDSGFIGSEASRVSPLTQTPEHRPSRTATSGMRGRSGPASSPAVLRTSLREEAAPLQLGKELLGVYTPTSQAPPRGSARKHSLPHGSHSQTSFPPQWTNSIASEAGPDADISHTDSEAERHSGASTPDCRPSKSRCPSSSTATSPSPVRAHHGLLGSRVERDQAIRALQDEVSRLRQRLEESLPRSHSYPEGKSSPRTARSRRQPTGDSHSVWSSAPFGKSAERSPGEFGEPVPVIKPAGQVRSASLPRDGPEMDLASASGRSPPRARDGKPRTTLSSRQGLPRTLDTATFRGHYTGTQYHLSTPASPEWREEMGPTSCLHCQGTRTQAGNTSAGDTLRPAQHSTPRKTRCPTCNGTRSTPASKTRDKAARVAGRGAESASSQGSGLSHKPEKPPQQQQQPGLWYLAAPLSGTAVSYIPTVPLATYSPSVVYCSPPAPTSGPRPADLPPHDSSGYRVAELKPWAARQQAQSRHPSLKLDFDSLEDLNWSLSRAVEAAKSVKFTTKQMNRSLTSELSKARILRRSCLF